MMVLTQLEDILRERHLIQIRWIEETSESGNLLIQGGHLCDPALDLLFLNLSSIYSLT